MGFGSLRVINEDWIAPGTGFGAHPHKDMEIITYIISGSLTHQDSLGHESTIGVGEIQRMTAGSGIVHSEVNESGTETHLLQIWIRPESVGLTPSYEQRLFKDEPRRGNLTLIASRLGRDGSLSINQDVDLYMGRVSAGNDGVYAVRHNAVAWIQLVAGQVEVNNEILNAGDGAAISAESKLDLKAVTDCEFLLFDMQPI
jgi:redox-sensitive bicupin YhaK (pirin superfamily)